MNLLGQTEIRDIDIFVVVVLRRVGVKKGANSPSPYQGVGGEGNTGGEEGSTDQTGYASKLALNHGFYIRWLVRNS